MDEMVLKAIGIWALQKYSDRVKVHHSVQFIHKRREKTRSILVAPIARDTRISVSYRAASAGSVRSSESLLTILPPRYSEHSVVGYLGPVVGYTGPFF